MSQRTIFLTLILLACVIGGSVAGLLVTRHIQQRGSESITTLSAVEPQESVSPSPIPEPPQHLSIPALHIEANVEYVGLDAQKRMDVPKDPNNVAWYKLGPVPGMKGNAVLAGHLDSTTGPAIFYNLHTLKIGDELTVTDANGKHLVFRVTRKESYPYDNFPLDEVFGPSDTAHLNLITCEGSFNHQTKNYSHRTVIYTDLVPEHT